MKVSLIAHDQINGVFRHKAESSSAKKSNAFCCWAWWFFFVCFFVLVFRMLIETIRKQVI